MSLQFDGLPDAVVNIGNGASLNNLSAGALLVWMRFDHYGDTDRIYRKRVDLSNRMELFNLSAAGNPALQFNIGRATSACSVRALYADFAAYADETWVCIAVIWDLAGADADQKMLVGNLSLPLAEPSSYNTQLVGSGAQGNDATASAGIGGAIGSSGFNVAAEIAVLQIESGAFTVNQALAWQRHFQPFATTVGAYQLGYAGTGTQPDYSGHGNTGTVTDATVSDHVPIVSPFAWHHQEREAYRLLANRRPPGLLSGGNLCSSGILSGGRL